MVIRKMVWIVGVAHQHVFWVNHHVSCSPVVSSSAAGKAEWHLGGTSLVFAGQGKAKASLGGP